MKTYFQTVYDCFFSKITDDMYMELDECQTEEMLDELLLNALPWFEFPRVNLNSYDLDNKYFDARLTDDEINIIATYMVVCWFDQQLASVEVARMKYSGSDFKMTSQANHMSKLLALKKDYERVGFHLQRLYKRRKADKNGILRSTFSSIMGTSVREGNVGTRPVLSNDTGGNRVSNEEQWEEMPELASDVGFATADNESVENRWRDMRPLKPCEKFGHPDCFTGDTDDNSWQDMEPTKKERPSSCKPERADEITWKDM